MAVELGWKEVIRAESNVNPGMYPHISALPYVDSCTRNGNTINYTINFALKLDNCSFWDYIWWIDVEVGANQAYNRLIKPSTAWRQNIVGKFWYMSSTSGHLIGSVNVAANATYVPIRLRYHDSNNNWSGWYQWNMEIPRASAPSNLKVNVDNITEYTADISASISNIGSYSTSITKWELSYYPLSNPSSKIVKSSTSNVTAKDFALTDLLPNETYNYTIKVTNNLGLVSSYNGTFKTDEEKFCYKITSRFKVGDNPNNTYVKNTLPNTIDAPITDDWEPLVTLSDNSVLLDYQRTSAVLRVRLHEVPGSDDEATYRLIYERNVASQTPSINEKNVLIVNAKAIGNVSDLEIMDYISGPSATGSKIVLVKPYVVTESGRNKIVSMSKI